MQDTTLEIVDARLMLTSGGRDFVNHNIAHKGGIYFDYGLKMLSRPSVLQDSRP